MRKNFVETKCDYNVKSGSHSSRSVRVLQCNQWLLSTFKPRLATASLIPTIRQSGFDKPMTINARIKHRSRFERTRTRGRAPNKCPFPNFVQKSRRRCGEFFSPKIDYSISTLLFLCSQVIRADAFLFNWY